MKTFRFALAALLLAGTLSTASVAQSREIYENPNSKPWRKSTSSWPFCHLP
ncbi:hypothetical protein [Hymenobacter oligotrophus]|uniref:hypothetical protein n=1 Tax=Hymenobacter oligotrophus TaxID=2319843 RepID=UPI001F09F03F|nr:hypothetical protein [Hymenobacter oligotrophus]